MKILRLPLFMRPDPESELELTIDRALRRLPERQAPLTLMPRVRARLAERARLPWWRKSYAFWPWPARLAYLAASTGLAALLLYFTWGLSAGASLASLTDEVGVVVARVDALGNAAAVLAGAAVSLGRAASPWVWWAGVGMVGMCYLTTLALGTFCYRLVSQRI